MIVRRARMKRATRAVRIGDTPCGLGVFARRKFRPRETIADITGRIVDDPDYWSEYCIDLGDGRVLEPDAPIRFINHSCQPNCLLVDSARWDDQTGEYYIATRLKALVAISAGDELTIDYAWPASCAIPCLCGSPQCRGWIVAPQELGKLTHFEGNMEP